MALFPNGKVGATRRRRAFILAFSDYWAPMNALVGQLTLSGRLPMDWLFNGYLMTIKWPLKLPLIAINGRSMAMNGHTAEFSCTRQAEEAYYDTRIVR